MKKQIVIGDFGPSPVAPLFMRFQALSQEDRQLLRLEKSKSLLEEIKS